MCVVGLRIPICRSEAQHLSTPQTGTGLTMLSGEHPTGLDPGEADPYMTFDVRVNDTDVHESLNNRIIPVICHLPLSAPPPSNIVRISPWAKKT
jgi:hypothetical protein